MNYKLRIYKTIGTDKGNLDREEFFTTRKAMDHRYSDLFVYEHYGLNPTAWKLTNGRWERIFGY